MPQPPQPPAPDQPPVGPEAWWSEIESRPDVAPPRTSTARPSTAPASRPTVGYGIPQQSRKPYPIIILSMLLVVGVGVVGAGLLSNQGHGSSPNTSSPNLPPSGSAPKAGPGPVPEVAPPAPAAPPAPGAPPVPAAPTPQLTAPGPPLAPAPAQVAPPRAGVVQRVPQQRSGKVRDEDNQRLRRAFTRYFCVHGELPASYCRGRA